MGSQFIKDLKRCYLIYGEEEYVKNQWLSDIRQHTVEEDDLMNYASFEGKDIEVTKLIEMGETMPFFAQHKLIVVRESGLFKTGKKEDTQKLVKWLDTLPSYIVIVFLEKEIDKRNGLYKSIQSKHEVIECQCPDEERLIALLNKQCKEKKLEISSDLLRYFIQNMPKSIHYMLGELEKLATYCNGKQVTKEAIDQVCIFSLEQRVFELLKEMSRKHTTQALQIYNRLIDSKESPIGILVLIARQYRVLLQVKYLVKSGLSIQQIAREVGIPLFVAKEVAEESKKFSYKQLQTILELCLKSDEAIKTGKMEQVKCIELLIMACIYNE